MPNKINFESSNRCNASCVFCPQRKMKRPRGDMSEDLFHKIIKEGKEMGIKRYSPFFMGEPFIFNKIWDWLDYMEKEQVEVALYTNGEHIDVERLSKYHNIAYLDFSINAATPETHRQVMNIGNYDRIVANYQKARKLGLRARASFVKVSENQHEEDKFRRMFTKTEVVPFTNWTGDLTSPLAKKGERVPCYVLFHQMMILWDGTVVPCCSDYEGKQVLGDANKQSLKQIWDNYSWLREKHKRLDFSTYVCRDCNYNINE